MEQGFCNKDTYVFLQKNKTVDKICKHVFHSFISGQEQCVFIHKEENTTKIIKYIDTQLQRKYGVDYQIQKYLDNKQVYRSKFAEENLSDEVIQVYKAGDKGILFTNQEPDNEMILNNNLIIIMLSKRNIFQGYEINVQHITFFAGVYHKPEIEVVDKKLWVVKNPHGYWYQFQSCHSQLPLVIPHKLLTTLTQHYVLKVGKPLNKDNIVQAHHLILSEFERYKNMTQDYYTKIDITKNDVIQKDLRSLGTHINEIVTFYKRYVELDEYSDIATLNKFITLSVFQELANNQNFCSELRDYLDAGQQGLLTRMWNYFLKAIGKGPSTLVDVEEIALKKKSKMDKIPLQRTFLDEGVANLPSHQSNESEDIPYIKQIKKIPYERDEQIKPNKPIKQEDLDPQFINKITVYYQDGVKQNMEPLEFKQLAEDHLQHDQINIRQTNIPLGPIINDCAKINSSTNSTGAVLQAVANRMAIKTPPVEVELKLKKVAIEDEDITLLTTQQVVEQYKDKAPVKYKRYKKALEQMNNDPNLLNEVIANKQDIKRECFLKDEQLPKIVNGVRDPNSARLVHSQPSAPLQLCCIKFMKVAKKVFIKIMRENFCIFASGFDDFQLGELYDEYFYLQGKRYRYYVGTDFTSFDATQRKEHYLLELQIYMQIIDHLVQANYIDADTMQPIFSTDELDNIRQAFVNQKETTMIAQIKDSFKKITSIMIKMSYQRKSGDANTSVGNSLINAAAINTLTIFKDRTQTSVAFIQGDDNLFGTNIKPDAEQIVSELAKCGLKAKVVITDTYYNQKFLQRLPTPIIKKTIVDGITQETKGTLLLRNPGRLIEQMQNCPKWCITDADKIGYIDQIIEGERNVLLRYPDVAAYFRWLRRQYQNDSQHSSQYKLNIERWKVDYAYVLRNRNNATQFEFDLEEQREVDYNIFQRYPFGTEGLIHEFDNNEIQLQSCYQEGPSGARIYNVKLQIDYWNSFIQYM